MSSLHCIYQFSYPCTLNISQHFGVCIRVCSSVVGKTHIIIIDEFVTQSVRLAAGASTISNHLALHPRAYVNILVLNLS